MALLLRNGAVFLHVPKTGGTWVTRVLEQAGLVRSAIATRHSDFHSSFHPTGYRQQLRSMVGDFPARLVNYLARARKSPRRRVIAAAVHLLLRASPPERVRVLVAVHERFGLAELGRRG